MILLPTVVPADVVHQIYSYLSPDELVEVEASDLHSTAHPAVSNPFFDSKLAPKDSLARHNLQQWLDTSDLWMKAVEKRGWTPYDIALLNSYVWSNEVRESKLFLEENHCLKGLLPIELTAEDVIWNQTESTF
jgi:hypothetical protein